jgi:predicted dehydrogenase
MTVATRPRLGFLGVGWIGRHRMEALEQAGVAEVAGVADPDAGVRAEALALAPAATAAEDIDGLLELDLDGIVIATPSALHAEQAIAALERGMAVFCQKPLARDGRETAAVLEAAQRADRLLGVDLSYRNVQALRTAHDVIGTGELGALHTMDLVFHNAYGPDKGWFTDPALAGGGCLIDLGTHLVDLALWLSRSSAASVAGARMLRRGRPPGPGDVEDLATVELDLDDGVRARVACSWFLPAGRECVFECTAWGTEGAISVTNVDGSFYDFRADRMHGTSVAPLVVPPDAWGGRAIAAWAQRLGADPSFDPAATELQALADVLDKAYAGAGR